MTTLVPPRARSGSAIGHKTDRRRGYSYLCILCRRSSDQRRGHSCPAQDTPTTISNLTLTGFRALAQDAPNNKKAARGQQLPNGCMRWSASSAGLRGA